MGDCEQSSLECLIVSVSVWYADGHAARVACSSGKDHIMVLVFDNDTRIEWPVGGHYAYVHKVDDGTPHDYFSFSWEKDTPEKSDFFHALADYVGYKEG